MERANTLTKSSLVLCLPTISIVYATPVSRLTLELLRSEHPCVLRNSPKQAFNYCTVG